MEKSGNLIKIRKSGKNQGILQLLFKKLTTGGFFFFKILNLMRIITSGKIVTQYNRLNDYIV